MKVFSSKSRAARRGAGGVTAQLLKWETVLVFGVGAQLKGQVFQSPDCLFVFLIASFFSTQLLPLSLSSPICSDTLPSNDLDFNNSPLF